ncbi:MAG: response regulator, partial [Methanomicrobiales archaeon]|nr:response regulator [Methanomicrobiales archaeon]
MPYNQIKACDLHENGRDHNPAIVLKNRPISILYLDDDVQMLEIMKRFLERKNHFCVTSVSDPQEALGWLCQGPYDCILSDYMMPVMDGISFYNGIRSLGILTPFILISSSFQEDIKPLIRKAGIRLFFTKQAILNDPCLIIKSIIQELFSQK